MVTVEVTVDHTGTSITDQNNEMGLADADAGTSGFQMALSILQFIKFV